MNKIVLFIIVSVMAIMVLAMPVISDSGNKPIQTGGSSPVGTDDAIITATKTDDITVDNDNDGLADPGDVIEYTVTIQNSGDMNATGTNYDDAIDANTTLNAGSIRTTPIARNDGYSSIGNVGITVPAGSGVLANDNDPDGTTPVLTIASFDATSVNGGTVSVAGDGSFTYDPPPGYEGTDSYTYTIQDSDGKQDPAIVFINITDVIWFIDNSVASSGNGTLNSPYKTIADYNTAALDQAGDNIFLADGPTYTTGITLKDSQKLIGDGSSSNLETITGITLPAFSNSLPTFSGSDPVITNSGSIGITLASNNLTRGLKVGSTTNVGISKIGGTVGTLTISEVVIDGSTNRNVKIENNTGTAPLMLATPPLTML